MTTGRINQVTILGGYAPPEQGIPYPRKRARVVKRKGEIPEDARPVLDSHPA